MDLGLADRVYVLTGASRGLGYAAAACLVADGANVVISGRNESTVDTAVDTLGPERAVGVVADLGDEYAPDRLVALALQRFGRLDGALVSVGGPPHGTALSISDDQWLESFQTVFVGAVRMARTVVEALPAEGGALAFVLSSSARSPIAGLGISNGLRPGLAGVAKDMADELGPRNIRVVSLLPHRILTDRNRDLFAATGDAAKAEAEAAAAIPLRRIGHPEEFGRVAAFVLSPAASYLTGLTLPIDGGGIRGL
jgi:3-oxoacyl-[acyl-carrier protein] reductase